MLGEFIKEKENIRELKKGITKRKMNKYTKERTLILKKGYRTWEIESWDLKYLDDKNRILISGYDFYGMYYQIEFKKILTQLKKQFVIEMRVI